MAISLQSDLISIAGSDFTTSNTGKIIGIVPNATMTFVYIVVQDAVTNVIYWRKVNRTDPDFPSVDDWIPQNMAYPSYTGDKLDTTNVHENCFTFDTTDSKIYGTFFVNSASTNYLFMETFNPSTGATQYGNKELRLSGTHTYFNQIRGVVKVGTTVYALLAATVAGTPAMYLAKWDISTVTFQNTLVAPDTAFVTASSQINVTVGPAHPDALLVCSDGNLLLFYDENNVCIKYDANLNYIGTTPFQSTNLGSMFVGVGGYFFQTNADFDVETDLTIHKWIDNSTGIQSDSDSTFVYANRLVEVGETTPLLVEMHLKDGFGVPVTGTGRVARFTIVTNRSTIDGDDSALGVASNSVFRDGNNIPLNRQLDVPVDNSGVARVYFQSARSAVGQSVYDILNFMHPIT
jgi:hypothetical protein